MILNLDNNTRRYVLSDDSKSDPIKTHFVWEQTFWTRFILSAPAFSRIFRHMLSRSKVLSRPSRREDPTNVSSSECSSIDSINQSLCFFACLSDHQHRAVSVLYQSARDAPQYEPLESAHPSGSNDQEIYFLPIGIVCYGSDQRA